jgi:SAM-dependent methyltransferase
VSWLRDPESVREQYATADNLRARQALYEETEGEPAPVVLWRVLTELAPRRVLEVGGGPGELAARLQDEQGVDVRYVDISPGMAELARARGLDAQVGDVQQLPFADASFDSVVAAWMLYHVPDVDRGLAEIARVLVPGGTLVAVTNSLEHLKELRALMPYGFPGSMFSRENGDAQLRRHFSGVRRVDADTKVTVRAREKLVAYQQSMQLATSPIPDDVPLPLVTYSRVSIFIATK